LPVLLLTLNLTLDPLQNDKGPLGVTVNVAPGLTLTAVTAEVAEHPPVCVTFTV
jgi:hypothetical protein